MTNSIRGPRAGKPKEKTMRTWFKRTHTTRIGGRLAIYGAFPRKRYWLKAAS